MAIPKADRCRSRHSFRISDWLCQRITGVVHGTAGTGSSVVRFESADGPPRRQSQFRLRLAGLETWLGEPRGYCGVLCRLVGPHRIECEADIYGHFEFSYCFDHDQAGDVIKIQAAGYQQRGSRDFMKIAGQWLHNDSPYDLFDCKGASDSITLTVYESPIELTFPRSGTPVDPQSGVLRIRRNPSCRSSSTDRTAPDSACAVRTRPEATSFDTFPARKS